mmetsp:Transcript_59309/g.128668  ORF Transcript_59309/g.128668 Transcript_59309/m.128668 type:complete len:222 (-) Transcript_59309:127-792(-)
MHAASGYVCCQIRSTRHFFGAKKRSHLLVTTQQFGQFSHNVRNGRLDMISCQRLPKAMRKTSSCRLASVSTGRSRAFARAPSRVRTRAARCRARCSRWRLAPRSLAPMSSRASARSTRLRTASSPSSSQSSPPTSSLLDSRRRRGTCCAPGSTCSTTTRRRQGRSSRTSISPISLLQRWTLARRLSRLGIRCLFPTVRAATTSCCSTTASWSLATRTTPLK